METQTLKLEDRISNTIGWILNSGIQAGNGGFYSWRNLDDESNSYLYSEITGYAITILCFMFTVTKDDVFLIRAEKAAKWIMNKALHPCGGVLTRNYLKNNTGHYSFERANIYAFDCGMVAFGFLKLYEVSRNPEYLGTAKKIIEFLMNKMLKNNEFFYPVYDAKNNKAYSDNAKWSKQSGSFHCKLALCLSDLAVIEGDEHYKGIALNLIASSIKSFYDGHRFITNISDASSHFHPYSYTIEGILYYAHKFGDTSFDVTVNDAFKWMLRFQGKNGCFPTSVFGRNSVKVPFQRSDIQAQILRLYYLFPDKIKSPDFNVNELFTGLLGFQNSSGPGKGSFGFGFDEDGSIKNHSNSWCSMFALQALYLAQNGVSRETLLEYLV